MVDAARIKDSLTTCPICFALTLQPQLEKHVEAAHDEDISDIMEAQQKEAKQQSLIENSPDGECVHCGEPMTYVEYQTHDCPER